jgi:hypothetical protein
VDRRQNKVGQDYIIDRRGLEQFRGSLCAHDSVILCDEQRKFIERRVPKICERGGWTLIQVAAAPDHVHVVLEADQKLHGNQVRRWLKRWLSDALSERWSIPSPWWAEGGSARAVHGRGPYALFSSAPPSLLNPAVLGYITRPW